MSLASQRGSNRRRAPGRQATPIQRHTVGHRPQRYEQLDRFELRQRPSVAGRRWLRHRKGLHRQLVSSRRRHLEVSNRRRCTQAGVGRRQVRLEPAGDGRLREEIEVHVNKGDTDWKFEAELNDVGLEISRERDTAAPMRRRFVGVSLVAAARRRRPSSVAIASPGHCPCRYPRRTASRTGPGESPRRRGIHTPHRRRQCRPAGTPGG